MITVKKIIVSTDLSDASVPAIGYAMSLARAYNAELAVVHVLRTNELKGQFSQGYATEGLASPAGTPPISTGQVGLGDLFERKKPIIRAFVEQRLGIELSKAVTIKPVIKYGNVAKEIVAAAKEEKCDLIVMASQASRLSSLFRAKLTERVARQAPCPVLLIPPTAEVTTDKNERVPITLIEKWAA
ncbi:MAG: universal stress protein [Candidatus Binatia bacterium]